MSGLFLIALLLPGASGFYLYVVSWSFRAGKRRVFALPWLLLPLGGALLAGGALVLGVPASPASLLALRVLELLAHLCAILLIWAIAGKIAPAYRLAGTWLYAWNPLVLIELAVYASTAGVVTCLLLLAVALLMLGTPSSSFTGSIRAFRRDGGRGCLRDPRALFQANAARYQMATAGDASVPSPTERANAARYQMATVGDASVPSQPDPSPAPTENERPFFGSWFSQIAALVLIALAIRINLLTLLLAPLLLWFMVRHGRGASVALMGFAWRALVVLGVFVLAYLPDWRGNETFLAITNGLRLFEFANSPLSLVVAPVRALFIFVAQRAHFPSLMQPTIAADMTVLASSFFLFALLYVREMGHIRARMRPLSLQDGGDDQAQSSAYDVLFTSWAVVIVGYIVLAATVFLPGYIGWGVWVVALRRFDTLSVCVLLLSCSALLYYPLQWFGLASAGFLVPLCVFGVPLVYLVVHYCLPASRMEGKKVLK